MRKKGLRLSAAACAAALCVTVNASALSIEEAYDILQRGYVDKLPRAAKEASSLEELFSFTDDYTYYMTEDEYQAFLAAVEGETSFAGIGAEITYMPEGIRIVSVLKGGGAEQAGEKSADGAYLRLVLNGMDFYVDVDGAQQSAPLALQAILLALAPDAEIYWGENGSEARVTSAQARERCGYAELSLEFADASDSEYADEIHTLAAYRIVFGADGSFRPKDTMTRAEVCALLAQALDLYSLADGYFADVPAESWYAPSVNAMAALGLVSGVGGGRFDPNATMTQEEYITVLGRLVEFLNLDARAYLDDHPLAILQPLEQYRGFSPWAIRSADMLTGSVQAAAALCNALRVTGVLKY